jgi:hypothetical protein
MENAIHTLEFPPAGSALSVLRRFAQKRAEEEHCDFCAVGLGASHRHLLEVANRRLICVCDPCALRFQDTVGGRFKLIPRDPRALPDFQITDAEWESLALPINLAFFFQHGVTGKTVGLYPSPAGAMESLLPLTSWAALVEKNPALTKMAADTEALLVNRVAGARCYFVTPIDSCFELAGLIRAHWRGLSGGEPVWEKIGKFFDRLNETAGIPTDIPREVALA